MEFFLIGKQIVDLLHEFKFLDYAIMLLAIGLFAYKFAKKKIYLNLKEFVIIPDIIVFLLAIIYTCSIIRHPENSYNQYIKTMSAFFMYYLGRVYGDEIVSHSKGITFVSYFILYINFIYRIFEKITDYHLPFQQWNFSASGGLYFYKTDLLLAVIISIIFIYAFARKCLFKYISIFGVGTWIAFSTTARMGQMILLIEFAFIALLEIRQYMKLNMHISLKLIQVVSVISIISITLFLIAIQMTPVHYVNLEGVNMAPEIAQKLEDLFHSRHIVWWDSMHYFSNQNIGTRLIGIDLWSESLRNSRNDRFHCLYMKMIYSVGYIGVYLFASFIISLFVSIRKKVGYQIKYLTIGFWIMFLLIGISMEALEYTQMSWYPFVFAGAIMTGTSIGKIKLKK